MEAIMAVVECEYNNPEYAKRRLMPDVIPTLQSLGSRGVPLAIVTNLTEDLLRADAGSLEIDLSLFSYIQTVEMCEHKKPDARVFAPLTHNMAIAAHNLLYFGDELKDYHAITGFGGSFIGVETGFATAAEFDTAGAFHIPSIADYV